MMGVDAAAGAEEWLRRAGIEAVACQRIVALQDPDPAHFGHHDDGAAHPAIGTGAAQRRIEAVAQRRLEAHRAAMALAGPNLLVARHIARVSVQIVSNAVFAGVVARMSVCICGNSGPRGRCARPGYKCSQSKNFLMAMSERRMF